MSEVLARAEVLLGAEGLRRLAEARFILLGAGGVGSWCAEGLVRTGARRLVLVDGDVVAASNVNRQVEAVPASIGEPKVAALRRRLLEIAPEAEIEARQVFFDAASAGQFVWREFDCVLDAIDSVASKALLIRSAVAAGVTVFSSMGAALKFDPTLIRTGPLSGVQRCGLAKAVRRELKDCAGAADVVCVSSTEEPMKCRERGSLVQVTAAFGFALCGLAVERFAGWGSRCG